MNSEDDPKARQPDQPAPPFPPGLEFLSALRKAEGTEDIEEKIALSFRFLEQVRNHRELLQRYGYDPDRLLALQPSIEALTKAERELQQATEVMLHAAADQADAARKVVDATEAAVNTAAEQRPFDPQVQEWKEQVEELRKIYPKLD